MNNENPITYTEATDRLTIEITGAAFGTLKRIADTLNAVPWCAHDNAPGTVLDAFVCGFLLDALTDEKGIREIVDQIPGAIETDREDGTSEDISRRAELRAAFERAGLI